MKKFRFSLETVMEYKNQVLDELKIQHGRILADIKSKQEEIKRLESECAAENDRFNKKKEAGMAVLDAMSYKTSIKVMQNNIREEYKNLDALNRAEEEKRNEVVQAKKETASLEKLKEKKIEEYNFIVMKDEEQRVEEYVSNQRSTVNRKQ